MTDNALEVIDGDAVYVPALAITPDRALANYQAFQEFRTKVLRPDVDYGVIPGTDKPTLLKPGAEKLSNAFGLSISLPCVEQTIDWERGFWYFKYRCDLTHRATGTLVASSEGSCNSMESRYRWRWVSEHQIPHGLDKATLAQQGGRTSEFQFAIDKAETTGKYGKPASYWQQFKDAIAAGTAVAIKRTTKTGKEMDAWEINTTLYRVPNDDIMSLVNTGQKIAQKRAFVGTVLLATNASDSFTQDVEDMDLEPAAPAPKAPARKRQAAPPPEEPPAKAEAPAPQAQAAADAEPDWPKVRDWLTASWNIPTNLAASQCRVWEAAGLSRQQVLDEARTVGHAYADRPEEVSAAIALAASKLTE